MEMGVFSSVAAIIIVLLDLWALNSVWRTTKSNGTKIGWTLLIIILPLVGLVIWAIAGPRGVARAPTSPEHSKG